MVGTSIAIRIRENAAKNRNKKATFLRYQLLYHTSLPCTSLFFYLTRSLTFSLSLSSFLFLSLFRQICIRIYSARTLYSSYNATKWQLSSFCSFFLRDSAEGIFTTGALRQECFLHVELTLCTSHAARQWRLSCAFGNNWSGKSWKLNRIGSRAFPFQLSS